MLAASVEHMKAVYAEIKDERLCMTDNVQRADVRQIALLALSEKDLENLKTIAAADGRLRNYAALIRRLIAREAKGIRENDSR